MARSCAWEITNNDYWSSFISSTDTTYLEEFWFSHWQFSFNLRTCMSFKPRVKRGPTASFQKSSVYSHKYLIFFTPTLNQTLNFSLPSRSSKTPNFWEWLNWHVSLTIFLVLASTQNQAVCTSPCWHLCPKSSSDESLCFQTLSLTQTIIPSVWTLPCT